MSTKQINWGIIGCGDVTEVKSGPAFNRVPHSSLVAVMRRDAAKAKDYAQRHGVPKWYSNADELINDPGVNAVYVATPPDSHEAYTIQALRAGKPVYVEKPMTLNTASAKSMLQASLDTGIKLSVAHYRKEQPRFKKVKQLIDSGHIGSVRLVNLLLAQPPSNAVLQQPGAFWRIQPDISGGGLFHDLSPHQLDLLQYFFGKVKAVKGFSMNQGGLYKADDLVAGNLLFENGVACTASWCFTAAKNESIDHVQIIGSEGSIQFTVFSTHHITVKVRGEERVLPFDDLPHVQEPMIKAVTAYFLGLGPNPSPAESAVETMAIMDALTG